MKNLNDCLPLIHRQHGTISRAQLRRAGATDNDIRYALNTARVQRIFPGVYRLFGAPPTVFSRLMAVSLWAGPNGCLSHLTAAWLHGLELSLDAPLHVDALFAHGTRMVPPPNVQIHLSRNFSPKRETTTINGISCTTLPRTLIDLAALFDIGTLEIAVDAALRKRPLSRGATVGLLDEYGDRGIAGVASLRLALQRRTQDSAFEVKLLRLMKIERIPLPRTNERITDERGKHVATVDFVWRKERVILQAHGYAFHGSRAAFEKDHQQSSRLTALGWRVLEVTYRRFVNEPQSIVDELRRTLDRSTP